MENRVICNCKKVTLFDIEDALHSFNALPDVEQSFKKVQEVTHCSTGCGGCYSKVLDAISELMMDGGMEVKHTTEE